jgi:hypothetical protein
VLRRFVFRRLQRALLPDLQRRWSRDIESSLGDMRARLVHLETELSELRAFKQRVTVEQWSLRVAPLLAKVDRIPLADVRRHLASAIASAALVTEPTTHMVVREVLPAEVYDLLVSAIPPSELFPSRDPVKRDFEMSALDSAPPLTRRMWRLFDEDIVAGMIAPLVFERFRSAIVAHYAETGGERFGEQAAAIPHRTFAGRIQLRHPGYQLKPHLDPKRVVITGLCYFPRPGETAEYGTQLFTTDRPIVAPGLATFFPESAGAQCTLARTVPYEANTMLVFVNSRAAHGASLPVGAALSERYTYQFYVKPIDNELKKLLRSLPPDARAAWDQML